ncbi:hypothetical protein DIE22_36905 [Burkholderia sp. Bp9142]|nr:hypothetical protein DIE22_36905 [Burkholderia sp. Bp9142]
MTLIDTTDNILMLGAYGWAHIKPVRKLYYNITISSISVAIAVLVGSIEGLGLFAEHFRLSSPFWNTIAKLNDSFGLVGIAIVGPFLGSWLCSAAFFRWKRFDDPHVSGLSSVSSESR